MAQATQEQIDCWWAELQEIEKAANAANGHFFDPWKSSMVDVNGGSVTSAYWEGAIKGGYVFDNMNPGSDKRKRVGGGRYEDGDEKYIGHRINKGSVFLKDIKLPSCIELTNEGFYNSNQINLGQAHLLAGTAAKRQT